MSGQYTLSVTNHTKHVVNVYLSTLSKTLTDPPSTDASDYRTVHTYIGKVGDGRTSDFALSTVGNRVVFTQHGNDFPIKVQVVDYLLKPTQQTVLVTHDDEQAAERAQRFFLSYTTQPLTPAALQFYGLVTATSPAQLNTAVTDFFGTQGYPGVDYALFSSITHWYTQQLYGFPGVYKCYQPTTFGYGMVLPDHEVGTITIQQGRALYTPVDGGASTPLTYADQRLASANATKTSGIEMTGMIRDLTWEGYPSSIVQCFSGHKDGQRFIAQSHDELSFPWYVFAYDLLYGGYECLKYYMIIDMALQVVGATGQGLTKLIDAAPKIFDSVRQWASRGGETAAPETGEMGGDVDPVNVDVDVDIDIDVDVDVDIDVDIDVDVDVDVDVDIDFGVVVDVDVDVDIDVDIDVVTDTDTDIDIDVDVDVDTDVEVQPGAARKLASTVGNWLLTEAAPTLVQGLVVYATFQGFDKLFHLWQNADDKAIRGLEPRQATGLGLLVNFMLNDHVPIATRWTTIGDYASRPDTTRTTLQMVISSVLMTAHTDADTQASKWRWSTQDRHTAVAAMRATSNDRAAFAALGAYTHQGLPLPVKVGAQVAMDYAKDGS